MEEDGLEHITNGDEPCSYCSQRPAVYHETTGCYWCQQCLDQHHAAMLALVNDLVQVEQRLQLQGARKVARSVWRNSPALQEQTGPYGDTTYNDWDNGFVRGYQEYLDREEWKQ